MLSREKSGGVVILAGGVVGVVIPGRCGSMILIP
jgi:hypothetical protein